MTHDHAVSFPARAYAKLIRIGSHLQSAVLLLVRLAWGWELYLSGYRHLHNVDVMVKNFTDWGVPFPRPNVYLSGITELLGGVLVFFGFFTRGIAVPLFFNFCVAYATASKGKLHEAVFGAHLDGLESLINDDAFPFMVMSLLLLAFGPGRASVDHAIKQWVLANPSNLQSSSARL